MEFDKTHTFQFVLFRAKASPISLSSLSELVAKPVAGDNLSLSAFQSPTQSHQVRLNLPGSTPAPVLIHELRAASGIWRLTVAPDRIDLVFDAQGFKEVTGKDRTLEEVYERVKANLRAVGPELGVGINRVALVVTGRATAPATGAAELVAKVFFSEEVQGDAKAAGETVELTARVTRLKEWHFSQGSARVNHIQRADARVVYSSGKTKPWLEWQWDFNTSPLSPALLSAEQVGEFFEKATQLTSQGMADLSKTYSEIYP